MAPRPSFPVCPGEARSGRNQGAKHQAAPLGVRVRGNRPTWIRDEAVEKGTTDSNETSRNSRMQVGPALPARTRVNFRDKPVQGAGEERGWRLAQRVGTLKAFRGAPRRFGRPAGRPRQTVGMASCCSAFALDYLCGVLLVVLLLRILVKQ
nr:hypothetical protein pPsy0462a_00006 [Pseudomonas syringae]